MIIEKPFGRDYESARKLNKEIREVLDEKQIYRIDHYLGKETVQNILVFRFANGIFEPIWNRRYIDHIQITVAETVGVEQRGGYYDKAGTLRDMVPNHIFQLISLTAMEPPVSFDADVVRDEQAKILRAIQPMTPKKCSRARCAASMAKGMVNGAKVAAYRAEPMVPPDSRTETFVAMKLFIDNWRWADVPFYLRTGKAPAQARHRDRDSVQARALRAVPQDGRGSAGAEPPGAAPAARRRDFAQLRRQDSRARWCRSARWT